MEQAKELEKAGLPGPATVKAALSKAKKLNTLINAVRKFQAEHDFTFPSLPPALVLLDGHNVRRAEFRDAVVLGLSEKLVAQIKEIGKYAEPSAQTKLELQLENSFKLYKIPHVRPVVLETLKQLKTIPQKYLDEIANDAALYEECDLCVKQKIWVSSDALFEETLEPLIDEYLWAKYCLQCNIDASATNFFTSETTRSRRQQAQVQAIIATIGRHEQLYSKAVEVVRRRFAASAESILCSLRMELLLAASDVLQEAVMKIDPAYEMAKCVDACMRDKALDSNLTSRLRGVLDRRHDINDLGHISMIAWDPQTLNFFCSIVVKYLREGTTMPRDSLSLQQVIKLIALGSYSHKIVSEKSLPPSIVNQILVTKYIPFFASMMLEDVMRIEASKATVNIPDELVPNSQLTEAPDFVTDFLRVEVCAALLWFFEVIDLLPLKKRTIQTVDGLRYFKYLPILKSNVACGTPWAHLLVHRLISANLFENVLQDETLYRAFVRDLLLENIKTNPTIKYQLLRIVHLMHNTLGLVKCGDIMQKIDVNNFDDLQPKDYDKYVKDYLKVMEKITPKAEEEVVMPAATPFPGNRGPAPVLTPPGARIMNPAAMTPSPNMGMTGGVQRPAFMTPRH